MSRLFSRARVVTAQLVIPVADGRKRRLRTADQQTWSVEWHPVLIWFGRPIEPNRPSWVSSNADTDRMDDPPLDQDELEGLLTSWQHREDGWWGQVEYAYPVHGHGMTVRYLDWFPAERLRPR